MENLPAALTRWNIRYLTVDHFSFTFYKRTIIDLWEVWWQENRYKLMVGLIKFKYLKRYVIHCKCLAFFFSIVQGQTLLWLVFTFLIRKAWVMWTIKIIQYLYKIINLFFVIHSTKSQADNVIYLPVKGMLDCNWSHLLWLSEEKRSCNLHLRYLEIKTEGLTTWHLRSSWNEACWAQFVVGDKCIPSPIQMHDETPVRTLHSNNWQHNETAKDEMQIPLYWPFRNTLCI